MPTYEYKCGRCGHEFELFQSMTAKPVKKCPECGGGVKRLIGKGAGIIFKGSGFYATDYKKGEDKSKKKEIPDQCKTCRETGCDAKKDKDKK